MVDSRRPLLPARRRVIRVAGTGLAAAGLVVGTAAGGPLAPLGSAGAAAGEYEIPFPCGQTWTGSTRSYHSPSRYSVDFNAPDDYRAAVVASAAGSVDTAYSYPSGGYGRWVRIDHGDGRSTLYAHLDSTAVKVGQRVAQGEMLGRLGTSGNSTGPHLHYEQREGYSVVPPRFSGSAYGYGTTTSRNCPGTVRARGDVPLAGDTRRGPRAELVIFRPQARSIFFIKRWARPSTQIRLGGRRSRPLLGDWDGDGNEQPGVRLPGQRQFRLLTPSGARQKLTWGRKKDRPIAGDWDGDGDDEVGLHRRAKRRLLLRSDRGAVTRMKLGDRNDVAVTGDWNGDGRTDTAAFDRKTAQFTLRTLQANGRRSVRRVSYGQPGDLPVSADWNGDGVTDLGVWRPSEAVFYKRKAASPTSSRWTTKAVSYGESR